VVADAGVVAADGGAGFDVAGAGAGVVWRVFGAVAVAGGGAVSVEIVAFEAAWESPKLWRLVAESEPWESPVDGEFLMTNAGPVKVVEVCRTDFVGPAMRTTMIVAQEIGRPLG
jgi:hypothetical protein